MVFEYQTIDVPFGDPFPDFDWDGRRMYDGHFISNGSTSDQAQQELMNQAVDDYSSMVGGADALNTPDTASYAHMDNPAHDAQMIALGHGSSPPIRFYSRSQAWTIPEGWSLSSTQFVITMRASVDHTSNSGSTLWAHYWDADTTTFDGLDNLNTTGIVTVTSAFTETVLATAPASDFWTRLSDGDILIYLATSMAVTDIAYLGLRVSISRWVEDPPPPLPYVPLVEGFEDGADGEYVTQHNSGLEGFETTVDPPEGYSDIVFTSDRVHSGDLSATGGGLSGTMEYPFRDDPLYAVAVDDFFWFNFHDSDNHSIYLYIMLTGPAGVSRSEGYQFNALRLLLDDAGVFFEVEHEDYGNNGQVLLPQIKPDTWYKVRTTCTVSGTLTFTITDDEETEHFHYASPEGFLQDFPYGDPQVFAFHQWAVTDRTASSGFKVWVDDINVETAPITPPLLGWWDGVAIRPLDDLLREVMN